MNWQIATLHAKGLSEVAATVAGSLSHVIKRAALATALMALMAAGVPAVTSASTVTLTSSPAETTTLRLTCYTSARMITAQTTIQGPADQYVAYRLHAYKVTGSSYSRVALTDWTVGRIAQSFTGVVTSNVTFTFTFTGAQLGSTYNVQAEVLRLKPALKSTSPITYEMRWFGPEFAWPQATGTYTVLVSNPWVAGGRSSGCAF